MKCYWKKSNAKTKYQAIPITEHKCFAKKDINKLKSVSIDNDCILSALIAACPDSALAKHK